MMQPQMPRPADPFASGRDRQNFRRRLLRWFMREGRDLPWRRTRDPYAILVSEIMLQQTQVATVVPYFQRWMKRFPNTAALARASEIEVLRLWQGLGYYSRARSLQVAAQQVMQNFAGQIPSEQDLLACLPGIGRYTAGAIASFAFDQPQPIVEANIARVLMRLTNSPLPVDTAAGRKYLWRIARELLPARNGRAYNSALMDLGATVCRPRQPLCPRCPVRPFCCAKQPGLLPRKKPRPQTIRLVESHAFARKQNRVLLEQSRARWRGMWILPRISKPPKRLPALRLEFPFTHHRVTLAVFEISGATLPNVNCRWFSLPDLTGLPVPTPHRRALSQLLCSDMRELSFPS